MNPPKKNKVKENRLVHIPILGYFFRKIAENQEALERTLKTGKETTGEIKKKSFLGGLVGMSSGKKFNILKLGKNERKIWSKHRRK